MKQREIRAIHYDDSKSSKRPVNGLKKRQDRPHRIRKQRESERTPFADDSMTTILKEAYKIDIHFLHVLFMIHVDILL